MNYYQNLQNNGGGCSANNMQNNMQKVMQNNSMQSVVHNNLDDNGGQNGSISPETYGLSSNGNESQMPETLTNDAFIPSYLRHQIGKWMRVEFLVGNIMEEKVGQLIDVGASYIVLKMLEPSTTMLCDIYCIKFITIIYDAKIEKLYTR